MKFHVLVPLVLSGCLLALPAAAQAPATNPSSTSAKSEDAPVALPTFIVDSSRDHGYFATNTLAGTRTNERLVNIPQNIQIINPRLIEDLSFTNPLENMKYGASGIVRRSGFAGDLFLRGYRVRNLMKDNVTNAGGNILGSVPMYDIDRIEVVKGPAALLYGQSAATGGIVNYVSKRPTEKMHASVKATVGTDDLLQGEVNSSGPLGALGHYRVTAAAMESDGPRDRSFRDDRFISVGFRRTLSPVAVFSTYYSYYHVNEIISAINVNTNGQLVRVPERFTYYEPWVNYPHYSHYANASLKAGITPTLHMNLVLSFALENYSDPWDRIVMGATNATTGLTPRTYQEIWDALNRGLDLQSDFVQAFNTGPIEHKLGFGGLILGTRAVSALDARNLAALDISNPVYNTPKPAIVRGVAVAGQPAPSNTSSYSRQDSGYLQDNISLFKGRLLAVGGLRYNHFTVEDRNRLANTTTNRKDKALVKRWGVVFKPVDYVSIYYNYSQSFAFNAATFLGGPRHGQQLNPSYGINREIGIKAEAPNQMFFGGVAVYDLNLTNVARVLVLPDGTSGRDQEAKQTSPGVEVDAGFNLKSPLGPLEILGTYFKGNPKDAVGARALGIARNTWSVLLAQSFAQGSARGLKLGFGVYHKGDMIWASPAPVPNYVSPAYTTTTAFASYVKDRYRLSLNVDNLADRDFIDGGENSTWLITNPGRTIRFSVEYRY